MLTGENGILNQANRASTETAHSAIYEQIALKNSEYYLEKTTGKYNGSLIDYLKDEKKVINQVEGADGYVIDVVQLMGEKQKYGNGTDGKTDVYKLEEVVQSTGSLEKIASIGELKVAVEESNANKKYNVVYCKTESDKKTLGTLEDNTKNEELITFTIDGESYKAVKGMTWKEWRNSKYYEDKAGLVDYDSSRYLLGVEKGEDVYCICDDVYYGYDWEDIIERL